jgi:hypothetical protein
VPIVRDAVALVLIALRVIAALMAVAFSAGIVGGAWYGSPLVDLAILVQVAAMIWISVAQLDRSDSLWIRATWTVGSMLLCAVTFLVLRVDLNESDSQHAVLRLILLLLYLAIMVVSHFYYRHSNGGGVLPRATVVAEGSVRNRTPATPLRFKMAKLALITLATLFTVNVLLTIYLDLSYHDTRPTAPDSLLGRTVAYRVHGRVVYLTIKEANQLEYLHWGGLGFFFGMAIVLFIEQETK